MGSTNLRMRFAIYIHKNWIQNNHNLKEISCVYAMLSYPYPWNKNQHIDIEYIGSTTKLRSRYKSHKIPKKIQNMGRMNILYFVPMKIGFYDYEIKLIKKLQPKFNRQHK